MKAKTMFKKLGYEDLSYMFNEDYFKIYRNNGFIFYEIYFSKEYKCVEIKPYMLCKNLTIPQYFVRLDTKLLQAINKQVEELGWNNE